LLPGDSVRLYRRGARGPVSLMRRSGACSRAPRLGVPASLLLGPRQDVSVVPNEAQNSRVAAIHQGLDSKVRSVNRMPRIEQQRIRSSKPASDAIDMHIVLASDSARDAFRGTLGGFGVFRLQKFVNSFPPGG